MNNILIAESIDNLRGSATELQAAVEYLRDLLRAWEKKMSDMPGLFVEERKSAAVQCQLLSSAVEHLMSSLKTYLGALSGIDDEQLLQLFIDRKRKFYSEYRVCLSQYAALMTELNWQSPAIKSSLDTRMGVEKSSVQADWNDYKRDRSEDTFHCEKVLSDNVIKTFHAGAKPVLNVFNSGMGAFTAIMYFLICEGIIKSNIVASSHIYVENRMLLKNFFKDGLKLFDSNDTDTIIQLIFDCRPDAIFIEPVSNTSNLRLFDVQQIIRTVSEKYNDLIYFVVDVTCSVGFENLLDNVELPENVKVLLHGSLLKAPQLGVERVNAGFVQTFGLGEASCKILDYRTLSGTNIQDFAANLLPFTTKTDLRRRMKIIEGNAVKLAIVMDEVDRNRELFSEVIYPGLPSHRDYELSGKIGFSGFFFNIKLIKELNHDEYFEMFTKAVIAIAKREKCEIVHGASFGFNHTSIYYSVGWDEPENHYIRISTGTETTYEVEKIKNILIEAYHSFKNNLSTDVLKKSIETVTVIH